MQVVEYVDAAIVIGADGVVQDVHVPAITLKTDRRKRIITIQLGNGPDAVEVHADALKRAVDAAWQMWKEPL